MHAEAGLEQSLHGKNINNSSSHTHKHTQFKLILPVRLCAFPRGPNVEAPSVYHLWQQLAHTSVDYVLMADALGDWPQLLDQLSPDLKPCHLWEMKHIWNVPASQSGTSRDVTAAFHSVGDETWDVNNTCDPVLQMKCSFETFLLMSYFH